MSISCFVFTCIRRVHNQCKQYLENLRDLNVHLLCYAWNGSSIKILHTFLHLLSTIYNHLKYAASAGLFDGHLMGLIIKCFCLGYKLLVPFYDSPIFEVEQQCGLEWFLFGKSGQIKKRHQPQVYDYAYLLRCYLKFM